jgi:hypothetical protein
MGFRVNITFPDIGVTIGPSFETEEEALQFQHWIMQRELIPLVHFQTIIAAREDAHNQKPKRPRRDRTK